MKLFTELNLNSNIQAALEQLGFTEPTEIQKKAIPVLLNEDVDFHGQAQTGTGKTLAFGIPLVQKVDPNKKQVQALIVAPTRELVLQICESLKKITINSNVSVCTIYGGSSMIKQINDLRKGVQIVVGTPGRLNDHLRRKTLNLKDLQVLVLDEADIMLDMGFKEEIDEILQFAPKNRKIWLFSATIKQGISDIKNKHMQNVVTVRVSPNNVGAQNTKQYYCVASVSNRLNVLRRIIDSDPEFYGFIFCPTKALTSEIAEKLTAGGYNINCLHGDMEQSSRTRVISQFRQKKFSILIATDVAARGIDVPDITHVINFHLPNDQESYVHRIGRTGRAGKTGIAITFISNHELRKIKFLSSKFNVEIKPMEIPSIADVARVQLKRIESYIANLMEGKTSNFTKELSHLINHYSKEQVDNILINLLNEKFFKDFETNKIEDPESRTRRFSNNGVELEINLGLNDQVSQNDIKNYFVNKGKINQEDLLKIKVLRKKSFIVLPATKAHDVLPLLRNGNLNGRRARVSIVRQQN